MACTGGNVRMAPKLSDVILQHYYNLLCCLLQQLIIGDVISDGHVTTHFDQIQCQNHLRCMK